MTSEVPSGGSSDINEEKDPGRQESSLPVFEGLTEEGGVGLDDPPRGGARDPPCLRALARPGRRPPARPWAAQLLGDLEAAPAKTSFLAQERLPWLGPEGCSREELSLSLKKMPSRTNLAASIPSSKVKYSKLACTDEGYIDLQFKKSPPKVPYKAIALATVLFLIGTLLIIIGALLLAGYISQGGTDRAVPVLIIGILVFLPGFYHLRIAYFASKGYRGYSYDDIPDFDD